MNTMTRPILAALLILASGAGFAQAAEAADELRMGKMHQTMQQIRQTEDPERRAELLQVHLDEMHAVMARMHNELGELMKGVKQHKRQTKRLHDHRKMK